MEYKSLLNKTLKIDLSRIILSMIVIIIIVCEYIVIVRGTMMTFSKCIQFLTFQ